MFGSAQPLPTWVAVAAAAMAIGFQVQTTAHIGDSQIRLAIADFFIPVIFVIALAHSPGFFTARWRVRHIWAWLGVLSAAFTIALVVGRIGAGEWIRWAVVNKYAGWYVLLMYFLVGGWLAAAYGDVATQTFLRWFLVAFWASCALVGFRYFPQFELGSVFFLEGVRFQALMENPNAFGILAALAIAVQAPQLAAKKLFTRHCHVLGLTVAFIALVYSGSRSAWLGLIFGYLILIFTRSVSMRHTLAAGVLASFVFVAPVVLPSQIASFLVPPPVRGGDATSALPGAASLARLNFSDKDTAIRMRTMKAALAMWQDRPIVGVGLGGYIASEKRRDAILAPAGPAAGDPGRQLVLIHNSALWLLTETGLLGAAAFIGFFLACFHALGRDIRSDTRDPLSASMLAALFVFAGASLGTEVLYQRHFWFLLGCALALQPTSNCARSRAEGAVECGS